MENQNNIEQRCPPPFSFENKAKSQNKLEDKTFYLNLDDTQYELIITLFDNDYDKQDKIFNFKLINIIKILIMVKIYGMKTIKKQVN